MEIGICGSLMSNFPKSYQWLEAGAAFSYEGMLRGVSEKRFLMFQIFKYLIYTLTEPAMTVWAGEFCLRQRHNAFLSTL